MYLSMLQLEIFFLIFLGKDKILSRLSRWDEPLPPPPIHLVKAPVPEISPMIMEDKGAILHLLESDLQILKEYAGYI